MLVSARQMGRHLGQSCSHVAGCHCCRRGRAEPESQEPVSASKSLELLAILHAMALRTLLPRPDLPSVERERDLVPRRKPLRLEEHVRRALSPHLERDAPLLIVLPRPRCDHGRVEQYSSLLRQCAEAFQRGRPRRRCARPRLVPAADAERELEIARCELRAGEGGVEQCDERHLLQSSPRSYPLRWPPAPILDVHL
eukprot:3582009-Rhodomonas_salina.1